MHHITRVMIDYRRNGARRSASRRGARGEPLPPWDSGPVDLGPRLVCVAHGRSWAHYWPAAAWSRLPAEARAAVVAGAVALHEGQGGMSS